MRTLAIGFGGLTAVLGFAGAVSHAAQPASQAPSAEGEVARRRDPIPATRPSSFLTRARHPALLADDVDSDPARARYVSVGGSNAGDGSKQSPWRTIAHALKRTKPGDVIVLRHNAQPFEEWIEIKKGQGGAPGALKVIRAAPGEKPVIQGIIQIRRGASYLRLEGLTVKWQNPGKRGVIDVAADHVAVVGCNVSGPGGYWSGIGVAATDVLIEGNEIHHFGTQSNLDHGIYVSRGKHITLRNNHIHHVRTYGIHVYDHFNDPRGRKGDRIEDLLIEGNLVHENGNKSWHTGIVVVGRGGNVRGVRFIRNVIWGHRAGGIRVSGGNIEAEIYHNTIYEPRQTGIEVNALKSIKIKNNLLLAAAVPLAIGVRPAQVCAIDHNGIWPVRPVQWLGEALSHEQFSQRGFGAGDVLQDPLVRGAERRQFALRAGSPAIDAGADVGRPFSGLRPDLGAFEFVAADTTAGR